MPNHHFWQDLLAQGRPIMALAPMADVTDAAFRRIIAKYGKPDITWTEFVSADGLCSAGYDRLIKDLRYDESERPIVAQIFGKHPETMRQTAKLCGELGFDGIDINMGCPERNLCKSGSCSALIRTPELAQEVVLATKDGAGPLPVSVKTRLGFNRSIVEDWVEMLVETKPAALIMHGRTRKQMSKVPADWEAIAVGARIAHAAGIPYLGNGDVKDWADGLRKSAQYGVDGVMFGRAAMGNPWLFNADPAAHHLSLREKTRVMLEHAYLYEELYSGLKRFVSMRKHFKAYVAGYRHSKALRMALMEVESADETHEVLERFFAEHEDEFPHGPSYTEERFGF